MTATEFKNEFLLEYDSHGSNRAPGMNDYMISYWLTRSQLELVKDTLSPKSNRRQEGFEQSETRRAKLNYLLRPLAIPVGDALAYNADVNFTENSKIFNITGRILEIKNEYLQVNPQECDGNTHLKVVPKSHDEATDDVLRNPFRKPGKWFAWRLDLGFASAGTKHVEIISNVDFLTYKLRVIDRPLPIIVGDLTVVGPTLSIDGETQQQTCELDEQFHPEIVTRAVTNALENVSNPRFQSHMAMDQLQIE